MATTLAQVTQLSQAQKRTVLLAQRELQALFQSIGSLDPSWQRDLLLDAIPALVRKYGNLAATAAAEWYEQTRATQVDGVYAPTLSDVFPDKAIQNTVRYKSGELFNGNASLVQQFIAGALNRWVQYSGRETIARNVRLDPSKPRYARIPTGVKTCVFCELMSSRGFVYASAGRAGDRFAADFHKYHDDCDCVVAAQWDSEQSHIEGYDPDAMYSRYLNARDQLGENPSTKDILATMRRMNPDMYSDGVKTSE